MQTEQVNYYDVGTLDDIVLSNSALNKLDPEMNGSPRQFLDFFNEDQKPTITDSMETGTLIHEYTDKEDQFIIAPLDKPGEHSAKWAEEVYLQHGSDPNDQEILNIKAIHGIHKTIKKPETALLKFEKECWEYLQFLGEAEGKVVMTASMREKVVGCYNALREKRAAYHLLFEPEELTELKREKELEVYTNLNTEIKAKAKLDCVLVDEEKKVIILPDLKTTSYNPYSFVPNNRTTENTPFERRKYYRQLAWYGNLLRKQYGQTYTIIYKIIVVSTVTFECAVFNIDYSWIKKGINELRSLLSRFNWHQQLGYDTIMEELVDGTIASTPCQI